MLRAAIVISLSLLPCPVFALCEDETIVKLDGNASYVDGLKKLAHGNCDDAANFIGRLNDLDKSLDAGIADGCLGPVAVKEKREKDRQTIEDAKKQCGMK